MTYRIGSFEEETARNFKTLWDRLDSTTRVACEIMDALTKAVDWEEPGYLSAEVLDWWKRHQEQDALRKKKEQDAAIKQAEEDIKMYGEKIMAAKLKIEKLKVDSEI